MYKSFLLLLRVNRNQQKRTKWCTRFFSSRKTSYKDFSRWSLSQIFRKTWSLVPESVQGDLQAQHTLLELQIDSATSSQTCVESSTGSAFFEAQGNQAAGSQTSVGGLQGQPSQSCRKTRALAHKPLQKCLQGQKDWATALRNKRKPFQKPAIHAVSLKKGGQVFSIKPNSLSKEPSPQLHLIEADTSLQQWAISSSHRSRTSYQPGIYYGLREAFKKKPLNLSHWSEVITDKWHNKTLKGPSNEDLGQN